LHLQVLNSPFDQTQFSISGAQNDSEREFVFKAANAGISPLHVACTRAINPPLQLSAKIGLTPCFVAPPERNPHRRLPNRIQSQNHLKQIQVPDCQVAALLYLPSLPLRPQPRLLQRCSRQAVLILLRIFTLRNSPQRGPQRLLPLRQHQIQLLEQRSRDLLLDGWNSTLRKFKYKKLSATLRALALSSANSLSLLGSP
jgi:hypothetical protein